MKPLITLGRAVAALFVAQAAHAASVLYQDDFSGTTSNLNGSSPDTTIGSNTWAGQGTHIYRDGTNLVTGNDEASWLPITLATNSTYTFTLSFELPSGTNQSWVAIGLANGSTPPPRIVVAGQPWALFRNNGQTSAYAGAGTANQVVNNAATGLTFGTGVLFTLKLTATTGATLANSTFNLAVSNQTTTYPLSVSGFAVDLSGVTNVGIGVTKNTGAIFQDFTASVVSTIPEPSTYAALLGGAVLAGACWTRRSRRS